MCHPDNQQPEKHQKHRSTLQDIRYMDQTIKLMSTVYIIALRISKISSLNDHLEDLGRQNIHIKCGKSVHKYQDCVTVETKMEQDLSLEHLPWWWYQWMIKVFHKNPHFPNTEKKLLISSKELSTVLYHSLKAGAGKYCQIINCLQIMQAIKCENSWQTLTLACSVISSDCTGVPFLNTCNSHCTHFCIANILCFLSVIVLYLLLIPKYCCCYVLVFLHSVTHTVQLYK